MRILIIIFIGILSINNIDAQSNKDTLVDFSYAKGILEKALDFKSDSTKTFKPIIGTKEQAISYAELILFDIYGKEKIQFEKPYQVHLIDSYWVLYGTLPKGYIGGVFEIVFDSKNGNIIMFGHGK